MSQFSDVVKEAQMRASNRARRWSRTPPAPKAPVPTGVMSKLKGILTSKGARRLGMYGLGAAGVAGGIAGIESLREALDRKVGKEKAFKNMIKDNPGLAGENPDHVKKVFNTLYTFNKDMAKDPLVAGSFTRRSLMFKDEGIQPMDVKTLTEIRKNMRDGRGGDSFARSVIGDAATLGGLARLAGG